VRTSEIVVKARVNVVHSYDCEIRHRARNGYNGHKANFRAIHREIGDYQWVYATYGERAQEAQFEVSNINKEVDVMRELTTMELQFVSGGTGECTEESANRIAGFSDFADVGGNLIDFYEGLIEATSYVIERVANAL